MNAPKVRPKRSLRSELVSLALVMALPVAIAAVFPWPAIGWKAAPRKAAAARCAFVNLSEKGEEAYLEAAKSAWSLRGTARRDRWIDMAVGELPPAAVPQAMSRPSDRVRRAEPANPNPEARRYRLDLMPESVAAAEPEVLKPLAAAAEAPAFSREELLEIGFQEETKGRGR